MKRRSEDYKSIYVKQDSRGLSEKEQVTGDELLLLSRSNGASSSSKLETSGVNRVSSIRCAIDNSISTVDYYNYFKESLSGSDYSSYLCTEFEASECFFSTDDAPTPIEWVPDYMTIPDINYSTGQYCGMGDCYTPNGSELILLGYCTRSGEYGFEDICDGNTFAAPLTNLVEGYISDDSNPINTDEVLDKNALSLFKNSSKYYINIDIVDRVGADSWLLHFSLNGYNFKSNSNEIYKFDNDALEYSNTSNFVSDFYYTTTLHPVDNSEYIRIHKNTLKPEYDDSENGVGGRAVVNIKAKSSDTIYLWAFVDDDYVPITSVRMSDAMTSETPSAYKNNSNVNFIEFAGNRIESISTNIPSYTVSWLDRDIESFDTMNFHGLGIGCTFNVSCNGCTSFYITPTHFMFFNPEEHSFDTRICGNKWDVYGVFNSVSNACFCSLKNISYHTDSLYIALMDNNKNVVFYPGKITIQK